VNAATASFNTTVRQMTEMSHRPKCLNETSTGWVQGKGSHEVLPFTRHQRGIHCKSRRLTHGANVNGRCRPIFTFRKEYTNRL